MADNVLVTPGSGANVRAKNLSGILTQIVQIDVGGESAELQLIADPTYGVPVDIKRFPAGAVLVNNPTAANLKVDASGATVPVSDAGGSFTVDAPAATPVFVRLSNGTIAVDTIPVSGTVTANQGTAAIASGAWPAKITDGVTVAGVDVVSAGLKVAIVAGAAGGSSQLDTSTFTQGTTAFTPIGGEYNTAPTQPASGQAAAAQITQFRGLHVNLRSAAGVEIGTLAAPARIDPTGTTIQPVSGTVSAKLNDNTGTAFGPTNALYVSRGGRERTRVTQSVAIAASGTGTAVWTPTAGKAFYVESGFVILSVGGSFELFDQTSAGGNRLLNGILPVGCFPILFDNPWASAAVNNILKYTTGTGITGIITLHGFEV